MAFRPASLPALVALSAVAVIALALAGCGKREDDGRTASQHRNEWQRVAGVDRNEVLPDGRRQKTILTHAYRLEPWRVSFHAEPFRTRPFSDDEAVWISRWRSNTENEAGEREPDDIHCHAIWSDRPVLQSDSTAFAGVYTDGFTPEFELPEGFALRVPAGQQMVFAPMFNNRRPDVRQARMRLEIEYQLESEVPEAPIELQSFVMSSTKPDLYWVPPKEPGAEFYRDLKTREVEVPHSGRVHGIGAHLHPFGRFVEFKRKRNGEVVFTAQMNDANDLEDQRLTTYNSTTGFYIRQGERFIVTTVYENPLDERIDAMGGLFILFDPKGEPDA